MTSRRVSSDWSANKCAESQAPGARWIRVTRTAGPDGVRRVPSTAGEEWLLLRKEDRGIVQRSAGIGRLRLSHSGKSLSMLWSDLAGYLVKGMHLLFWLRNELNCLEVMGFHRNAGSRIHKGIKRPL